MLHFICKRCAPFIYGALHVQTYNSMLCFDEACVMRICMTFDPGICIVYVHDL